MNLSGSIAGLFYLSGLGHLTRVLDLEIRSCNAFLFNQTEDEAASQESQFAPSTH